MSFADSVGGVFSAVFTDGTVSDSNLGVTATATNPSYISVHKITDIVAFPQYGWMFMNTAIIKELGFTNVRARVQGTNNYCDFHVGEPLPLVARMSTDSAACDRYWANYWSYLGPTEVIFN